MGEVPLYICQWGTRIDASDGGEVSTLHPPVERMTKALGGGVIIDFISWDADEV